MGKLPFWEMYGAALGHAVGSAEQDGTNRSAFCLLCIAFHLVLKQWNKEFSVNISNLALL
jgi:hypothetical protein